MGLRTPMDDRAVTIARLTDLLEVTRRVRSDDDLGTLLPAIAGAVAESLALGTVTVSLHRPAWDDLRVEAVHGSDEARIALLGRSWPLAAWEEALDERFARDGCHLIPRDRLDRAGELTPDAGATPAGGGLGLEGREDALVAPMRDHGGRLLGIVSVEVVGADPSPSDEDLRVLAALAHHAAQAVQSAQLAQDTVRYRRALEHLLRVSARMTGARSTEDVLQAVCEGIHAALGFENVSVELIDRERRRAVPKAVVGWTLEEIDASQSSDVEVIERLLDPRFEAHGCFLLESEEGCRRLGIEQPAFRSERNGRGPLAWDHHWLLIPLHDRDGALNGVIWADEPADRMLPSAERLQALRMFANQAATAIASAAQFEEAQFLADHDPLTRLGNRRAFTRRLEEEVARTTRYGGRFALVILDIDGFKALNDAHGHHVGDCALLAVGDALRALLREVDSAYRLGGDEFALILAQVGVEEATLVVDRLAAGVAAIDAGAGTMLRASFGAAIGDGEAADAETLLVAADTAMYEAKRAGLGVRFAAARPVLPQRA